MAGRPVPITGGAGFLGYYLVQSVIPRNRTQNAARRIPPTVLDSGAR
jgi:dTDP-glucose 4,6-dehydratase/UDP-glucuronate decarboxylase